MMIRFTLFVSLAAVVCAALWLAPHARTDQPSYDTVGPIEGEAISVQGSLSIEVVGGRTKTILRSGSDVRVKSGQARIDLVEGGQIVVCGPAHLSVLKSVNLLTLALDSGIIHAHIENQPALTIYTAQIQAKPFAISDAAQDALVGFDPTGAMCIRADSGAVRVEQQLTGQSIIVPQSGEVLISNGQLEGLRSGVTHCACELQYAKTAAPPSPQIEVSRLPTSEEMQKANQELAKTHAEAASANTNVVVNATPEAAKPKTAPAKPSDDAANAGNEVSQLRTDAPKATSKAATTPPKPAAKEGPVYQVYMPPLSYDASSKAQPENFDPQLIVLVRRVRVRPTLIFQGSVKDAPPAANNNPPPAQQKKPAATTAQDQPAQQQTPQPSKSIIARIRAFFRSLFS